MQKTQQTLQTAIFLKIMELNLQQAQEKTRKCPTLTLNFLFPLQNKMASYDI